MTYNVITQNNLTITKWLISLCNLSSRFPKSPKKKVALSRFTILLVGLPYIGWYHVNHYVQKRIECWHRCVESMFYLFQSDWTKIGGVSLICDPAYFCAHDPFWAYLLTLSYYNLETEAWVLVIHIACIFLSTHVLMCNTGQWRKTVLARPSKKICPKCTLLGTSGVIWGDLRTFWSDFRMQNHSLLLHV